MARKKKNNKDNEHYVDNKVFSKAVYDYVVELKEAEANNEVLPVVPNYIADSFMKISTGLTYHRDFIRYPYRSDLTMDGVENCLRAIRNYNINAHTRSGSPNAFSYFSKICYFAFLRRIKKEYAESNGKTKYRDQVSYDEMVHVDAHASNNMKWVSQQYLDNVRNLYYQNEHYDDSDEFKEKRRPSFGIIDSDLKDFMENEKTYEDSDS